LLQAVEDQVETELEAARAGAIQPYTLPETPEAVRYVEEGHARAKVVITI